MLPSLENVSRCCEAEENGEEYRGWEGWTERPLIIGVIESCWGFALAL